MFQLVDISPALIAAILELETWCINTVAMVAEVEASALGTHFTVNSWWKRALDHGIHWCHVLHQGEYSSLAGHGNGH